MLYLPDLREGRCRWSELEGVKLLWCPVLNARGGLGKSTGKSSHSYQLEGHDQVRERTAEKSG